MYRTCLFCQTDLGQNGVIEHLPIGRRLAFDAPKGRLWVVCRRCERWNLTPFDDRWEAIEECERFFRATRVRFSTDEIGLARLRDGTELVRIGEPLRPEFAAWRYGDQFGRRRVRHMIWASLGVLTIGAVTIAPKLIGFPIGGGGLYQVYASVWRSIYSRRTVMRIPTEGGTLVPVTQAQVESTRIVAGEEAGGWRLQVPSRRARKKSGSAARDDALILEQEVARSTLEQLLPRVNRRGGSRKEVQGAVLVLEDAPMRQSLIERLTRNPTAFWNKLRTDEVGVINHLPREFRLALEMDTHEEAERRWLAGELLELERAWREAEELAAIADSLAVPQDVEARLEVLRAGRGGTGKVDG